MNLAISCSWIVHELFMNKCSRTIHDHFTGEVFCDIMVPASQPPRPPRRCEHSNSKSIQHISFKFYMRVDTSMRYVAIEIVWLLSNFIQRWSIWSYIQKLSMTRLTPKLHSLMTLVSPKSSKCNISISNAPIAFKFYTEVTYLKLHTKYCQWPD